MRGRTGLVGSVAGIAVLVWSGLAEARTFEVTRANDPNPGNCQANDCSLREAVLAANERPGDDRIVLPGRSYELTRAGAGEDAGMTGDLDINNDPLSISHPGAGVAKIDAGGLDRVLHIQAGAPTSLAKLTITGGDPGAGGDGGGMVADANLKLSRTTVRGNVSDDGGGIDMDEGNLVMVRSALVGNETVGEGGGADVDQKARITRSRIVGNRSSAPGGGILIGVGNVTISRSTFQGNRSGEAGGGIAHVSDLSTAVLKVTSSTIARNRADTAGGGLAIEGRATIVNTTIDRNRADDGTGGGIDAADGAEVSLNAVTVTRNEAEADAPTSNKLPVAGGGIYREVDAVAFDVRNSLIALNTEGQIGAASDCGYNGDEITSLGNNLISTRDFDCDAFDKPGDKVRANPKVGTLRSNGGPTKTVALKAGSAAIGNAHKPSAPERDQRGRRRDGNPDIGAFERGA